MTEQFWANGKRAALSLSFDDGRPSQLDNGIPILNKYGIKSTFYVVPRNVENRASDWKAILADGHEIGNHTVSHPCSGNFTFSQHNALEEYSLARIEKELVDADAAIKVLLGVQPQTFAYPCGQSFVGRGENTQSYVPLIAKHFLAGRDFNGESANDPAFCDLAKLLAIAADTSDFSILQKHLDKTIQDGYWLILAMHDVDKGQQSVSGDVLRAIGEYTKNHPELWVDSIKNIAKYIRKSRL